MNKAGMIIATAVLAATMMATARGQERYELQPGGFIKVDQPKPGTPEASMLQIRQLIEKGQPKEAQELATQWIEDHTYHPLSPEAYMLRGDAKAARKHYFEALYDYEYVVRAYPEYSGFSDVLERELKIAQIYAGGVKRRLLGMRIMPAGEEAEELLIRIQERSPGSRLSEQAGITLADFYYDRSRMRLAGEMYDIFLQLHPRSLWADYATQQYVKANLAMFKGPRFDTRGLLEARTRLVTLKEQKPATAEQYGADDLMVRIDEELAEKALITAKWYDDQNKKVSALFMYRRVIEKFPLSAAGHQAEKRVAELEADIPGVEKTVTSQLPADSSTTPALPQTPVPAAEPSNDPRNSDREEAE